jgi:hypothetical protein
MYKFILAIVISIIAVFINTQNVFAIYDPASVPNNKFGIHILFPEEVGEAATLVNSSGGDWGYVTIPIRDSDRNLDKWQKFMDDCKKYHLIPIVRIATEGDYFVKGSWEIPSNLYVIDFANFLESLNWPVKNRYVVIFNETNRGDEWGGVPDAQAYANILNFAVDTFKKRSDKFFILMGGLDNASIDVYQKSVYQQNYIRQMNVAVPGIFEKIDGISAHAYPNPAFSSPPSYSGTNKINSFIYELNLIKEFSDKKLPVFITETGWSSDTISQGTQINYYKQAFASTWNDDGVIAVTPFIFHAETAPFYQFSFIKENKKTQLYDGYLSIPKHKGSPNIEPETLQTVVKSVSVKTKFFADEFTKNIYNKVNNQTKTFFRWLLNF